MTDPETEAAAAQDERGRDALRVVLDTNVPIAAHLSRNPHSPTIELLARWRGGQFIQLYSDDMLAELVEKFQARRVAADAVNHYLADLITFGEFVIVTPEQIPDVITADPDDTRSWLAPSSARPAISSPTTRISTSWAAPIKASRSLMVCTSSTSYAEIDHQTRSPEKQL